MQNDPTIEEHAAPDAEAAFLAAAIENPKRIGAAILQHGIGSDLFHDEGHGQLMGLILNRLREGKPIDPSSLKEDIRRHKPAKLTLRRLGDILSKEHDPDAWEGYISALRHTCAKRLLQAATTNLGDISGHDAVSSLRGAVERAQSVLQGSTDIHDAKRAVKEFVASLQGRFEDEMASGIPTGIDQIDRHTGGMRAGELWVIGAKTSGGKSVLMLQMAARMIQDGKRVLIFSLEMGVDEVVARMVSNTGSVNLSNIMAPRNLKKEEQKRIVSHAEALTATNMMICDEAGLSMDQITAHCLRQKETVGLDLVVIDYLQMVSARYVKGQNREQEVAGISRACKQLAKKAKCPIITATQLNEAGQSRESRAIEHDADNVLLIADTPEGAVIRFWKCRNGERGKSFTATLRGEYQRFVFA